MKKRVFFFFVTILIGIGIAHAQKAYTYIQQNDVKIDKVGTAAFDLSVNSHPYVEFVDGKAVMKIGDNTVAKLPMSDKGQLVVEFSTTMAETDLNKVSKTCTNSYATIYSPFQLTIPTENAIEVYAPTYDAPILRLNKDTKLAPGAIIPAGTGLILKNNGTITFTLSSEASTDLHESALSGSAITIAKPIEDGKTVYTLGHKTGSETEYGFFEYKGDNMNPGLAYLLATTVSNAKYVAFNLSDESTEINNVNDLLYEVRNLKVVENGRVVIVNNGHKYNLNGQSLKENKDEK